LNYSLKLALDYYMLAPILAKSVLLVMIIIMYCRLMVRITDTIIKNGYPHISAHYRNGVCTWPTYEEQNTLSSSQLYLHSQEFKKWLAIQQRIIESVFAC